MESISIAETHKTPAILSDFEKGIIEIKGKSNPENSIEFFRPLVNWAVEYAKNPQEKTTVNINLEHFNTSTSKCILDVFKKLEPILLINKEVTVNWHYDHDDEDLLEAGETFQAFTELPFNLIPVKH